MMATVSIFIFNLRQDFHQIHTLVVFVTKKMLLPKLAGENKPYYYITEYPIESGPLNSLSKKQTNNTCCLFVLLCAYVVDRQNFSYMCIGYNLFEYVPVYKYERMGIIDWFQLFSCDLITYHHQSLHTMPVIRYHRIENNTFNRLVT